MKCTQELVLREYFRIFSQEYTEVDADLPPRYKVHYPAPNVQPPATPWDFGSRIEGAACARGRAEFIMKSLSIFRNNPL